MTSHKVGDYLVDWRGECRRIDAITPEGNYRTSKAPPPRRIVPVPIFGRDSVPLGRRADVIAALPPDVDRECLSWRDVGSGLGAGAHLYRFVSRAAREALGWPPAVRPQAQGGAP